MAAYFRLTKSITNEDPPDYLDTRKDCCEEEIIQRGDNGFKGGDTIQTKLSRDCKTANINPESAKLKIRLSGWEYIYVSYMFLQFYFTALPYNLSFTKNISILLQVV